MSKIIYLNENNVKDWDFYKIEVFDQYREIGFNRIYATPKEKKPEEEKYFVFSAAVKPYIPPKKRLFKTKKQKRLEKFQEESRIAEKRIIFGIANVINGSFEHLKEGGLARQRCLTNHKDFDILVHHYEHGRSLKISYSELVSYIDTIRVYGIDYWDYNEFIPKKNLKQSVPPEYVWNRCVARLNYLEARQCAARKNMENTLWLYEVSYVGDIPEMRNFIPDIVAAINENEAKKLVYNKINKLYGEKTPKPKYFDYRAKLFSPKFKKKKYIPWNLDEKACRVGSLAEPRIPYQFLNDLYEKKGIDDKNEGKHTESKTDS